MASTKTFSVTKQMPSVRSFYGGAANPGDKHYPIGKWDPGTGLNWQTRLALYAPVSFTGMTSIVSARLVLFAHVPASGWHAKGTQTAAINARRKTADWSESSHGGSTSIDEIWGGNGSSIVENNFASNQGDDGTMGNMAHNSEQSIDITEAVKDWFNGSPNYGLMLYNASDPEDPNKAKEFWSRHASSGVRPYIEVTYETNTAPNAPFQDYPKNDAVRPNNTLNMHHSDPDVGDKAENGHFQLRDEDLNFINSGLNPDITISTHGVEIWWNANPVVSGVRYAWRGRTHDGELWGPFSDYAFFWYEPSQPAPTLSSPSNGSEISTLTPTLKCVENLLGESTMSHAQVRVLNPDGSTVWLSDHEPASGSVAEIQVPAGMLDWGQTYEYRYRVRTTLGTWSATSGHFTFTTQSAGSPQNVQPSGVKVADPAAVTISFDADSGDLISRWRYEVYAAGGSVLVQSAWMDEADVASVSSIEDLSADLSAGGDYEVRVQYEDEVSSESPWSSKQPFSINAPPSAPTLVAPTQGAVLTTLTPTLSWDFNDPDENDWGDTQSAYTIEVRLNSDDTLVDTLNGTTSESRVYDGAVLSFEVDYKWRVKTEDEEGEESAFSSYRVFTPSEPPTVDTVEVATADLTDGNINNPTPTIEWNYASPGSKAQAAFRLHAVRVSDENEAYDSGWIESAASSHSIPNSRLDNGTQYRFDVEVQDTDDLTGEDSSINYDTEFDPPAALQNVQTIADSDASKITLEWEAAPTDPNFDHIEVWRRPFGQTQWRVLEENIGENTTEYDDYTAALNLTYEYAVLQVHTLGTGLVQGEYAPLTTALAGVPQWYLVAENLDDLTVALEWAENMSDRIPVQRETVEALGRDFKIVVEGRVLGSEGEITIRVDGSEYAQVSAIEALLRARLDRILIKSPTGEVYPSKMGSIERSRGRYGEVMVRFPYTQIEES